MPSLHKLAWENSNLTGESVSATPNDVNHLFKCPANPTQLQSKDLWKRPAKAAAF